MQCGCRCGCSVGADVDADLDADMDADVDASVDADVDVVVGADVHRGGCSRGVLDVGVGGDNGGYIYVVVHGVYDKLLRLFISSASFGRSQSAQLCTKVGPMSTSTRRHIL